MKELKNVIRILDEKLDEMNERRSKWTKKEAQEYNETNNLRYLYTIRLENEQLKSKVKRLEKQLKEIKGGKII